MKKLLVKLLRKIAYTSLCMDNAVNNICFKLVCKLNNDMVIFRDYNIED